MIDLETSYPGIGLNKMPPGNEDHARRSAYWAVFSGACGHTYGANSIWQMYAPGRKPLFGAKLSWSEALDASSAAQMGYLRRLIESHPFLTQAPDTSLLAEPPADPVEHIAALRGDGYVLVYTPTGMPFRVRCEKLEGKRVRASWFDPRTGKSSDADQFRREGEREFTPPGQPGPGNDWVLVLENPGRQAGRPQVRQGSSVGIWRTPDQDGRWRPNFPLDELAGHGWKTGCGAWQVRTNPTPMFFASNVDTAGRKLGPRRSKGAWLKGVRVSGGGLSRASTLRSSPLVK